MGAYIARRLGISVLVLVALSALVYALINAAPGDPIDAMIDPAHFRGGDLSALRRSLGLDQPIAVRYVLWLNQVIHGNLGFSYMDRRPVAEKIGERLGPTFELAGGSLLLTVIVSIPLGILAATKRNSAIDHIVAVFSLAPISVPSFFLGLALIYVFAIRLQLLPLAGDGSLSADGDIFGRLRYLLLPLTMLAAQQIGIMTRYSRAATLNVLRDPYVQTARAKGLRPVIVLAFHVVPNAVIPLITVIALQIAGILSGAVLTEAVFQWPGLGSLILVATINRDYPTLMGIALLAAVAVLSMNLIADLLYAVVDPRVRLTR